MYIIRLVVRYAIRLVWLKSEFLKPVLLFAIVCISKKNKCYPGRDGRGPLNIPPRPPRGANGRIPGGRIPRIPRGANGARIPIPRPCEFPFTKSPTHQIM